MKTPLLDWFLISARSINLYITTTRYCCLNYMSYICTFFTRDDIYMFIQFVVVVFVESPYPLIFLFFTKLNRAFITLNNFASSLLSLPTNAHWYQSLAVFLFQWGLFLRFPMSIPRPFQLTRNSILGNRLIKWFADIFYFYKGIPFD